jgi:hypothetical protein
LHEIGTKISTKDPYYLAHSAFENSSGMAFATSWRAMTAK